MDEKRCTTNRYSEIIVEECWNNSVVFLHAFVHREVFGMKELLETLAKALVDYPEEVTVNEVEGDKSLILELRVAKEDMGKVIGKQGRIAKAIRTVVKAAAIKDDKRVVVEIMQ
jgi:uncharacterized protein